MARLCCAGAQGASLLVLCAALGSACGGDSGVGAEGDGGEPAPDAGDPGAVPAPAEPDLALEMPARGFILRTRGVDLAPGEERELCEVARIPGEPGDEYHVSQIELVNAEYSHHMGLAVAFAGTFAERELAEVGVGNYRECPGPLLAFGEGIELLGTTQVPRGQAALPDGVARKFFAGQYVVFNYHYYNPTDQPIPARSAAAFHVVDADEVEHLASLFSLNNVTIDVPPGQSEAFTGECHFETDMMVGGLTRHTHRWGTDFTVWFAGGERDGEEIWTSRDWEHETEYEFPEAVLLKAGEGLRYRCSYENDTAQRIRFGTTVTDEMCMLYGPVWPAEPGDEIVIPDCNIVWIDEDGIGHPAHEAGGFPEPSELDVALCRGALGATDDPCATCQCDHCAAAGRACALDPDCAKLFECLSPCTDLECTEACHPVVQKHSAGQGLLTALSACARVECSTCSLSLETR